MSELREALEPVPQSECEIEWHEMSYVDYDWPSPGGTLCFICTIERTMAALATALERLDKAERRVEKLEKFKRFILNKYDHQQNPDYAYEKWLEQEKAEGQAAIEEADGE